MTSGAFLLKVEASLRARASWLLLGVVAISAMTLFGKSLHVLWLQAWSPGTVTMKDTTAWLFLIHAFGSAISTSDDRLQTRRPLFVVGCISLAMVAGRIHEIKSFEDLGNFNPANSFYPSIVTMLCFGTLGLRIMAAGLFRSVLLSRLCSGAVALAGASAVAGYAFNLPTLYFFVVGWSTAMAINTAIAFLLLGCVPTAPNTFPA